MIESSHYVCAYVCVGAHYIVAVRVSLCISAVCVCIYVCRCLGSHPARSQNPVASLHLKEEDCQSGSCRVRGGSSMLFKLYMNLFTQLLAWSVIKSFCPLMLVSNYWSTSSWDEGFHCSCEISGLLWALQQHIPNSWSQSKSRCFLRCFKVFDLCVVHLFALVSGPWSWNKIADE